jgi:hypothetical protein
MPTLLIDGTILYRLYTGERLGASSDEIHDLLSKYERVFYEPFPGQSDLMATLHRSKLLERRLVALDRLEPSVPESTVSSVERTIVLAGRSPHIVATVQDYERAKEGPARPVPSVLGYISKLLLMASELQADLWLSDARLAIVRAWFEEAGIGLVRSAEGRLDSTGTGFPYLPRLQTREPGWTFRFVDLLPVIEGSAWIKCRRPVEEEHNAPPQRSTREKKSIFVSYSHRDAAFMEELERHLALMKRRGVIETWSDRMIRPADDWRGEISQALEAADIILLLVSADFCASDYCWDVEVTRALERHTNKEARVVPIAVRPCDWKGAPFGAIQGLPQNLKPITLWPDRDAVWLDVVSGIGLLLG